MITSALNKERILAGIVLLLAFSAFSLSCSKSSDNGSGSKGPGTNEVFIQNMAFDPGTVTISVNSTITWTNKDTVTHTVTSDNGLFDSGNIAPGGSYSHTFSAAGTYSYHCSIHASLTGVVKVNTASGY